MTEFLMLVIVETAIAVTSCEEYPQFPNHVRCMRILAEVRADRDKIEEVLQHFGASWANGRWQDVPLFLDGVRLRWHENECIEDAWRKVTYLTDPAWKRVSDRWGPKAQLDEETSFRKFLGDDWFDRGLLPVPLSHRGECPRLIRRKVELPDA